MKISPTGNSEGLLSLKIPLLILLLFFSDRLSANISTPIDSIDHTVESIQWKGYQIAHKNHEEGIAFFVNSARYFKSKNDTLNYVASVIGLSELEKHRGQFNHAFDILWDLQKEMGGSSDPNVLLLIHRRLGELYGLYGKDSLALHHLKKGLEIGRKVLDDPNRIRAYFGIAVQYVQMEKYDLGLQYIDSTYLMVEKGKILPYSDAYYGFILTEKGALQKADFYLQKSIAHFEQNQAGFLALVYYFKANFHEVQNEPDSVLFFLEKSVKAIDQLQAHTDIKPKVLEKLADYNFQAKQKDKAFNYLKLAKGISDSLFHTTSTQNRALFEIKSKYKEDLYQKETVISNQQKLLALKDKAGFRLKVIVGVLIFAVFVIIISIRLRSKMTKMAAKEKERKAASEAMIEVKNKELTVNTLQFIEKENTFKELLEIIKEIAPEKHDSISKKYRQSNKKMWDDFHLRFTQTNNKFYERLLELHPSLTPTDLKHCALIKLNFDSKEMSYILGISLHSVHMSRSRIRKKIGLNREDSLSGYLTGIVG